MTKTLPGFDPARPSTTRRRSRPLAAGATLLVIASLAACSPAAAPTASPGQTSNPTTAPTPSPTAPVGLEHPTGAKDVVLRFEESGGFVPLEWNATYAPSFTLYGDGTVVFKDGNAIPPESNDGVNRAVPFSIVKLDEPSVQSLLEEALNQGALAIATGPYMCNCADIPTATFTLNIGGRTKQVSVTGLSPDLHSTDQRLVGAISDFAEKLRAFGDRFANEQVYVPAAYRGILIDVDQPMGPVAEWPWKDIKAAEFTSRDNEFFKTRTLTAAEVEATGIPGIAGGMIGTAVQSEGKVYTLSLRPLLPDESK